MTYIIFNGQRVINNLCPSCEARRELNELEINNTAVIDLANGDKLLTCVHAGDASILDLGVCPCGSVGFLESAESQFGIAKERNDILFDLDVVSSGSERGTFCPKCAPVTCENCGKDTRLAKRVDTADGIKMLCSDCTSGYRLCRICGKVHTDKRHPGSGDYVCRSCMETVTLCPHCGRTVDKEVLKPFGSTTVCNHCSSEGTCIICDAAGVTTINVQGCSVCSAHVEDVTNLPEITDYARTRAAKFFTVKGENTNLFFGIENEVQLKVPDANSVSKLEFKKRLLAKICQQAFPTMETKRDGSLTTYVTGHSDVNNGVECVWQPMSYRYINSRRDDLRKMFDQIQPMLQGDMKRSGMHIHVNREAFTPLTFTKFIDFFYNLDFQPLLFSIAGRRTNDYAQIRTRRATTEEAATRSYAKALAVKQYCKKHKTNVFPDRYDVVNTTNSATHEVRIFKGANNYHEFMMRLEFMAALIDFIHIIAIRYTVADFCQFVLKHKRQYPELAIHVAAYKQPSDFVFDSGNDSYSDDDDDDTPCYDDDDDF